jgi:putative copper export protein
MVNMIQVAFHSLITFIEITTISVLAGVAFCLFWTAHFKGNEEDFASYTKRLRRLLMLCLIVLVISSISNLVQRTMEMSGLGITAILPVIPTVLFKTHYGMIGLVRSAGLGLALIIWFLGRRHLNSRFIAVLILCAAATIAFSRSATSHASDFGDLSLQEISDWFHLLAASAWGGVLIAVSSVFRPSNVAEDGLQQRIVAGIADKFYALFGPMLSLLVLTGMYNSWIEVGSFAALLGAPYGRVLLAKIILFLLLTFRYIAPPLHGQDEAAFAMKFLQRTRVEAAMMLGIFFCAAIVIHNIPARHFLHLEHMQGAKNQAGHEGDHHEHDAITGPELVVRVETNPKDVVAGTPVEMTVHIEDHKGRPVEGLMAHHERILHAIIVSKDFKIFAHIHPEDIGPISGKMLQDATFPVRFTFPEAGEYLIGLDFATADGLYSKSVLIKAVCQREMGVPKLGFSKSKDIGQYHITLNISPESVEAGRETTLIYTVTKNGKPVNDLEPYLGAPMHIAVVRSDLKHFIHAHGDVTGEAHSSDHTHVELPQNFGPTIEAHIIFPDKGIYKIYSQIQHQGKVVLLDFMVKVQ